MSNASPAPESSGGRQPAPEGAITIAARWEKPLALASGGDATLLVRVGAPERGASPRRAPLDVAFVLDRSGSMHGGKLELAKEGVSLALTRLRDADRAALVIYDDEVHTLQPLDHCTPRLKSSLRLAMHGVDPGGSTFLSGGWMAGCQSLAEAPALPRETGATRIRRTILLTDGRANAGIMEPRILARHAGELRQRGIATTTVGVGQDFDEGLLNGMAEAGGGNFQYVAGAEELREFFANELQELFSISATGLTITLELPPGLEADLVSAFPVQARGRMLEIAIGDVPAGDEIDLLLAVRVAAGREGDRLPLGIIASWTDPFTDSVKRVDASPRPLRLASLAEVTATEADEMVAERSALQRAAAERRAALDLDREGRFRESRRRMALAVQMLDQAPQSDDVMFDRDISARLAEGDDLVPYTSHDRKSTQHREALHRRGRQRRETERRPEPR